MIIYTSVLNKSREFQSRKTTKIATLESVKSSINSSLFWVVGKTNPSTKWQKWGYYYLSQSPSPPVSSK